MAVVADPGACAVLPGTREDVLVPSACLNATISGLVSRTVLRSDLTPPGAFHGAKVYPELAASDVSNLFVDTVAGCFDAGLAAGAAAAASTPVEPPTWSGWQAVERLGKVFGVADPNRIKPGLGEATRVLLRRTPSLLLVSSTDTADVAHLFQLAKERGVPVERYDEMPFAACGLVGG
jgi:hypothetical protein